MNRFLCNLGLHKFSPTSWGYGFGQVDVFCARCGKRIVSFAVGRLVGGVQAGSETEDYGA